MYSEWASLQYEIQTDNSNISVLHTYPDNVGKDVACTVVKSVSQTLSHGVANGDPSNLESDKQVQWTMEVLCYGLSLPLVEHETIKDCVNVYSEWFSSLTKPRDCVPQPIMSDPNPYSRQMLHHLYNVFVPRPGSGISVSQPVTSKNSGPDLIKRQALMCHRVLRFIQSAVADSQILTRETWECLLKFLLAINDTLLAPPTVKDSIGDQLCERVLSVLFEVWLLACTRCFPSPPLWKTFRDMSSNWRHHEALVVQWHRINMYLTSKLLKILYGPEYPDLNVADEQGAFPADIDDECLTQCWFRFLHILSNPVDLCRPDVISNTPKFLHMALTSESVIEPQSHDCLRSLPQVFFRAMRSISVMVDAFLGISEGWEQDGSLTSLTRQTSGVSTSSITPPQQRKNKTFGITSTSHPQHPGKGGGKGAVMTPTKLGGSVTSLTASSLHSSPSAQITLDSRLPLATGRPKVNSIMHLFGPWLIEAGLVGVKVHGSDHADGSTASSQEERLMDYQMGRAEACGTLCRIFCSHKTGEEILPVYLSRFYIVIYYGLQVDEKNLPRSGQVLANILFNATDLLRVDLNGVMILLPQLLTSLEMVLNDLTPKFELQKHIAAVELRKAAIHILLSMISLPLHFKSLTIKDIFNRPDVPPVTFLSLKNRMMELLLRALLIEQDATNTQMLLGGLMLAVENQASCERAEHTTVQDEEGGPMSPLSSDTSIDPSDVPLSSENQALKTALKNFDTATGLFGHATSLVCNRLMASWKTELGVALPAIEVLSGLAKVRLNHPNLLMCKRTVNWICEFIVYQCSRPAPLHSKDLHSMIVAAFHCLTLWLVEHEYLMNDKECLHGVLEVVELGISGSKSQPEFLDYNAQVNLSHKHRHEGKDVVRVVQVESMDKNRASDVPRLKGEKELKPVSARVKDAAEALLTAIMDHVGSFPPPCGPEAVCSLLDEETLLRYCKEGCPPDQGTCFRYFVLDGSIIIALLEQPLGNDEDPLPTVTALIRGPFGRHAWTMQLRHVPRTKKAGSRVHLSEPRRPEPMENVGIFHDVKHKYFPDSVNLVPHVNADKSIPSLSSVMADKAPELQKLEQFIRDQVIFENKVKEKVTTAKSTTTYPDPATECRPPSPRHEFQTSRMFLSHYGFLSLESLKEQGDGMSIPPSLLMLDSAQTGFLNDLEQLDNIPCRTLDTIHVFYVKSGQKMPFEILSNVTTKDHVQPTFLEFLRSLGWPVDVKKHAGWTGHTSTSWKIMNTDENDEFYPADTGGSLYDGRKQVLYWADVSNEIAIVVPSPETYQTAARRRSSLGSPGVPCAGPVGTLSAVAGFRRPAYARQRSRTLEVDADLISEAVELVKSTPAVVVTKISSKSKTLTSSLPSGPSAKGKTLPGAKSTSGNPLLSLGAPQWWSRQKQDKPAYSSTSSIDVPQPKEKSAEPVKPKTLALDLDGRSSSPRSIDSPLTPSDGHGRVKARASRLSIVPGNETKIFVVWLESYEDHETFPAGDLVTSTSTGLENLNQTTQRQAEAPVYILFIHALANGLFRVHLRGQHGRTSMAVPMVDGMVISRRTLGSLVRQTAINISRRRRLEGEAYQPPHVKRKLKIKELVDRYKNKMIEPEFYTAMFQS